jgi:hypothetical protein
MITAAIGRRPWSGAIASKHTPCVAESHHPRRCLRAAADSHFLLAPQQGTVSMAGLSGIERDAASGAADRRQKAPKHGSGSIPGKAVSVRNGGHGAWLRVLRERGSGVTRLVRTASLRCEKKGCPSALGGDRYRTVIPFPARPATTEQAAGAPETQAGAARRSSL